MPRLPARKGATSVQGKVVTTKQRVEPNLNEAGRPALTNQEVIEQLDRLRVDACDLMQKIYNLAWSIAARGVKHEPPPTDDIPF